jgi:hypothetical protein
VQELLFAIHNRRHTYDPEQPLTTWVQAIARYKLIDLLRRRSRTDVLHDPLDEDEEFFAIADTDAAEARYDVASLLRELAHTAALGRRCRRIRRGFLRCVSVFLALPGAFSTLYRSVVPARNVDPDDTRRVARSAPDALVARAPESNSSVTICVLRTNYRGPTQFACSEVSRHRN